MPNKTIITLLLFSPIIYLYSQNTTDMSGPDANISFLNQLIHSDNLKMIILLMLLFLFMLVWIILKRIKRKKNRINFNDSMPPNIWFYSKLLDLELNIEKPTPNNLWNLFHEYLKRKYKFSDNQLKTQSIFQLVSQNETDNEYIDLYGDVYQKIQDLKHSEPNDVILFIKSIKKYFNKEDLSEWIEIRKINNCNDC